MRGSNWLRGMFGLAVLGMMALACGDDLGPDSVLVPGQTDFTNAEPATVSSNRGGGYEGDLGSSPTGASNDAAGKTSAPGAPPAGRTGEVEEADIYKVDNNRLFYLNTYRGFLIYDMANPKDPKPISRLGVYGYPIEMYIEKNTVYALIKDALYLTQVNGKLEFKRHNVSQLVAIDISDLKNPKVIKTIDITGKLREGVSRKIQDTIYVVSYFDRNYYWGWRYGYNSSTAKEQAWVYSFNVANPKNIKLVDKLKVFEGGSFSKNDKEGYQRKYFSKVAISATSNALMVVENWRLYGYLRNQHYSCSSYTSYQEARVSIIDISDPYGTIKTHTTFKTRGELGDQFKQTYTYDAKTKKATYLGIFARREWDRTNCQGSSHIENTLESWDVTDGKNPTRQSDISFGKPNETVRGSVFDPDRKVAFAITARNVDPLYVLSYQDPKKLKILSEIDGLSGDMNVFRFIAGKKFLVGIGRDNSSTCTGFVDSGRRSTNVAVSIIDIRNLNEIGLVQRQCVAVKNASWVSSAVNWNLDQAHKMIGMHSDGTVNAITVPVYYYKKRGTSSWYWYGYETAVGLMTWDVSKYDPTKQPQNQTVLQNFGTIIHPKGQVRRSIVFTHKGTTNRRMVMNLSDTHVSLVDIQDLNNPVTQAMVEVAPYHAELYKVGNYMVEHVRSGGNGYYYYSTSNSASEFRIKQIKPGQRLEDSPEVASFVEGQVQKVVKWQDKLVLFRRTYDSGSGLPYYARYKNHALIYDLSNPLSPKKLGEVELPMYYLPYYRYWCGPWGFDGGFWFDHYYGYMPTSSFTATDFGLSFMSQQYDYQSKSYMRKMVMLDLDGSTPLVRSINLTSNQHYGFYGMVANPSDSKSFYLAFRVYGGKLQVGSTTFHIYKYFSQRWTRHGSRWVEAETISLPGRLAKVFNVGNEVRFVTHDYRYKRSTTSSGNTQWTPTLRLNMLRQRNFFGRTVAEFMDFHSFDHFYLKDMVVDSGKLYLNARPNTYWDYWRNSTTQVKNSDHLMIFDISGQGMRETYAQPTGTYNMQLMGTHLGKLFVNLPGDGVLVVDASNPAKPDGQKFMRTLGYATHMEFSGNSAYLAAGYFGVYEMNLGASSTLPTATP